MLKQLKEQGVKNVILNGFTESIGYVMQLTNIQYIGTTKSVDGYSEVHCFIQK